MVDLNSQRSATSNLVEDWLTWLKSLGGRSNKTIIAYRNDVFNFIKFMSKHFQNEISPTKLKTIELIDMRVMDNVGCEAFAENVFDFCYEKFSSMRVNIKSVKVFEHGSNSAVFGNF